MGRGAPPAAIPLALANFAAGLTRQRRRGGRTFPPAAPPTIEGYIAAIKYFFAASCAPCPEHPYPTSSGREPSPVRLVIAGHRRRFERAVVKKAALDQALLEQLLTMCARGRHDDHAAACAILFAFLGCLRGGNVVPDGTTFDPARQLRQCDVDARDPEHVELTIRVEKTNQQARESRKIRLYATAAADCPRLAALAQQRRNPNRNPYAPFFQAFKGGPLPRAQVERRLRAAASSLGRDPSRYTLHSPRIGMVNALLLQGYPMPFIKSYGMWASDAVFEYVRVQLPDGHEPTRPATASARMAQRRARRHVSPALLLPFLELGQR